MAESPLADPRYLKALKQLEEAVFHQRLGNFEDAEKLYARLVKKVPEYFDALHFYGLFKYQVGQFQDALKLVRKALKVNPYSANALSSLGVILSHMNRYADALSNFDAALRIDPNHVLALSNRCNALNELRRFNDTVICSDRVIALNPNFADVYIPRGAALLNLKRFAEAKESYERSIKLNPSSAMAWQGQGNVSDRLNHHEEAASAYAEALRLDPQLASIKGRLLHQKMLCCDWRGVNNLTAEIDSDIASGKPSCEPFGWQGVADSPRSLQLCAELFNKEKFPACAIASRHSPAGHKKIRIGYSSGELRNQATSHLIVGVFELHDKSRFEIFGIDNGSNDNSEIRRRIEASMDGVIDISQLSDSSAVDAICKKQIDILVNLNGYFGEHRTGIFAHKPSPIQVNYLGFPGTMGASYIDYIIADQLVIPQNHWKFYTEKVVYLPHCYQANDQKKEIGSYHFSRAECGLPDDGFVFCCFNNNYKILPDVFGSWMHILSQVGGSVLWLMQSNSTAASNLRNEAARKGVDPSRIIFAPFKPLPEHLARLQCADLFLDTLPYNAHTTASDALWSGLPILTQIGETFAGRVAASLLTAVDLPQLITQTRDEYEKTAITLASTLAELGAIKDKLARNRLVKPLFDTQLFTRHLEGAYQTMYERWQAKLRPDHIFVQH
jgi:predicted O-linked N-acetylglucosamine transferase (SPINDLY family)